MGCATKYNGYTATWSRGKLAKLYKGNNVTGTHTYNNIYNASGQRTVFEYTYTKPSSSSAAVAMGTLMGYHKSFHYDQSGRLIFEGKTSQLYGEGSSYEKIVYLYDESGMIGMVHTTESGTSTTYYYHRNLLGDVVGIYNTSGTKVGGYSYDAWGNCTITLDTNSIATKNPIRYRGYYYDEDTQLYYLNARYYSPLWRRFISPDDTAFLDPENVNGLNLYAYCNNDPVNYADPSGHFAIPLGFLIGSILIGAAIGAGTSGVTAYTEGEKGWNLVWDIIGGGIMGAAIGAATALGGAAGLAAAGVPIAVGASATVLNVSLGTALGIAIGGTAFASATKYSLDCAADDRQWSIEGYLIESVQGVFQGASTFGLSYLGGKAGLFNKIGDFKGWYDFYIGYGGMNNLKMISYMSNLFIGPTLSKMLLISGVGAGIRWLIDRLIPKV